MELNFKPLHKWVVIGRKKSTDSGILVINTADLDTSSNDWCEVIAVGPDCTQVKTGDMAYVLFQNRPTKLEGSEDFENEKYQYFLVGEYDFTLVKNK